MQTLHGALVALVTTLGVAVAVSLAFVAAGAAFERSQKRAAKADHQGAVPARHPAQADEAGELLLR